MKGYKKLLLGFLGFFLVLSMFVGQADRVEAQWATTEVASVPEEISWIRRTINTIVTKVKNVLVTDLVTRNLSMYMDNLAYNTAMSLGTGASGSKPLFETDDWGDVFKKTNEAALGNFIGELSEKSFEDLGINLCNPSAQFRLTVPLYLIDSQAPPSPKCNWSQIKNNWERFDADLKDDLLILRLAPVKNPNSKNQNAPENYKDFWNSFSYTESDFGLFIEVKQVLDKRQRDAEKAKDAEIAACKDYLAKKTPVTKETITSCSKVGIIEDKSADVAFNLDKDKQAGNTAIAPSLIDNIGQIMVDAGNRFINTYSARLMEEWLKGGILSYGYKGNSCVGFAKGICSSDSLRDSLLDKLRGGSDIRNPRDVQITRTNVTPNLVQLSSFSLVEDFSICPSNSEYRHPDNCVISTPFLSAVNSKKTVKQAVDEGIIAGNIPFIGPEDILRNLSDNCYIDALCHSNLVKLRKANIIPIGWELASLRSSITSPVTLKQAMDCFEDFDDEVGDCVFSRSDDYAIDGEPHNPFYHLVDPNWVLKIPEVICDAFVYSPSLESGASTNRLEYCADVKTCLREDDDGNCLEGNYGYCTQSKNTWRFNGDICEDGDLYSGCLTFNNSEYGTESYIEDSLDYCTSDEVGCRRYSQEIGEYSDWIFDAIDDDDDDLFLNNNAADCSSSEAGCHEYIIMAPDTGANLIPNGDFEIWTTDPAGLPDGFTGNASIVPGEGTNNSNGVLASYDVLPHHTACFDDLEMVPNTNYTISVDAKINSATPGTGAARISVSNCVDSTGNHGDLSSLSTNLIVESDPAGFSPNEANLLVSPDGLNSDTYTRISGTFNSGNSVRCSSICVGANYVNNEPHFFDNLKMEIVSQPKSTSYYSSYGEGATIYMNGNTFMCLAEEVGCMGYRPTNSDPMVPAIIDGNDLCPAECVGYSTFAEQLNYFDVAEGLTATDIEYHNFIAVTGQSCPLQEVGCEEFTNLDELSRGGEGTEYYSYLRQCVSEDDPNAAVYFTWEGSDVSGYQLKRWLALQSNAPGIPGPCTNITPDSNDCTDDVNPMAICGPETPATVLDDPDFDPNCREFIDQDGASFFRLQDRVIFASPECRDYRRSATGQVYRAISGLSFSCSAANDGCRSYAGNTDNNLRNIFSDNFENGTYSPWTNTGDMSLSSESLNLNGHSLRGEINEIFRRPFTEEGMRVNKEFEVSFWMRNESFVEDFTVELSLTADATNYNFAFDRSPEFFNIEAGNWHKYKASVYISEDDINNAVNIEAARLLLVAITTTNGFIYIDNVILKEVIENISVVKNSWNTPVSCDTPYTGYHLGCQAYIDINGNQFNLKSFNSLCREEAIGCLPAIDTQNSTYPFEKIYNPSCSDGISTTEASCLANLGIWEFEQSEITIEEDSMTYLVPDRVNYCASYYKGCQALGLQDREDPDDSSTVYKINDPDKYDSALCLQEALNCSAYNSDKGTYYFKDPSYDTCTYKKNVNVHDNIVSGWFSDYSFDEDTGLAFGCADKNQDWYNLDGEFAYYDLEKNFFRQALHCPSNKNLCTTFKDVNDPVGCDPRFFAGESHLCIVEGVFIPGIDGEGLCITMAAQVGADTYEFLDGTSCGEYYYYNNENISEGTCNGQVDQNGGCMLFSERNQWNAEHTEVVNLYDSNQTYSQNISSGRPLSPLVCGDFDPLCNLDSNRLVSVERDRQCSEWLACKSSAVVWDGNTESYRVICDEIGACDAYVDGNNVTSCGNWVTEDDSIAPLSLEFYQSRASGANNHVTWSDTEYTGYAVPGMLPVSQLVTYNFASNDDGDDTRLVYGDYNAADGLNRYHTDCVDYPADVNITEPYNGDTCQGDIDGQEFTGECNEGYCWVVPIAGETSTSTFVKETRGYAVLDAPFPDNIEVASERKSGYSIANICIDEETSVGNSCEDSYLKVTYGAGGTVKYYPKDSEHVMTGVCISGKVGLITPLYGEPYEVECRVEKQGDCNTEIYDDDGPTSEFRQDGVCQVITKIETVNNWSGVCLDYDYSTPLVSQGGGVRYYCNQWYPVNKVQGTNSLYNNYREAGYYNEAGNDILYCAIAEPYVLTEDRIYCGGGLHGDEQCVILLRVPAGSRIHLSGLGDGELLIFLNRGYLTKDLNGNPLWTRVAADDDLSAVDADDFHSGPIDAMDRPQTYFDRIEKTQLPTFEGDGRFNKSHFEAGPGEPYGSLTKIPILEPERINDLFDPAAPGVEYFYYDEDVNYLGNPSGSAMVKDPFYGFPATWGPECDLDTRPNGWTCDTAASRGGGHQVRNNTPGGEYHQIYSRPGGEGGGGGVYDCNGGCGYRKSKVCRTVYCNPLNHNYYVKAVVNSSLAPSVCYETDCSFFSSAITEPGGSTVANYLANGSNWFPRKGADACLLNINSAIPLPPEYQLGYDETDNPIPDPPTLFYPTTFDVLMDSTSTFGLPTQSVTTMIDESQCLGDPNCEYIYCTLQNLNVYDDIDAAGDLYCSDMGDTVEEPFTVQAIHYNDDNEIEEVFSWDFRNVIDITPCLDRLYVTSTRSIFDEENGVPVSEQDFLVGYPPLEYDWYETKTNVRDDLANQVMGSSVWNDAIPGWEFQFYGCVSDVNDFQSTTIIPPLELDCRSVENALVAHSTYRRVCVSEEDGWCVSYRIEITNYYWSSDVLGTPCDTASGCYYQCGVVTELDSEGNNSWVRTDVWWRSRGDEENGRLQPVGDTPWTTSYFSDANGEYMYNRTLSNYYDIEGENLAIRFSHFGGSVGSAADGLVVTQVPLSSGNSFGSGAAYTFFNNTSTALSDPVTMPFVGPAWDDPVSSHNDAVRQMVWLFGRAYNLQWNGTEYVNPEDMGSPIPHLDELHGSGTAFEAGFSVANPIMGDDYDPRIFKVCREGYCAVTDEITGDFLYNFEGITINNNSIPPEAPAEPFIQVIGRGGTLFTAMKFYYHAHPDHMPISNIAVDWNDSLVGGLNWNDSPGKYKNNLVDCGDTAYLPQADGEAQTVQGFGGLDRACREGYKVLYHTYEYDAQHPCDGTQPGMPDLPPEDEASCFQPKILVQDNWIQGTIVSFDGWVVVYND